MDEFISLRLNGKPTSCLEDLRKFSVKELQDLNTFSVKELQDLRTLSVKELQDLRKFSVKELLFVVSNQSYSPDSFMDHANCCIYLHIVFILRTVKCNLEK